jgi:hypothetical protein
LTLACGQDDGSSRAKEGGRQAEVEKQTGEQKHAGREERGCGQGGRDKQTEAMWQEEACSHLETEAGRRREADRRYRQAGKQVKSSHAHRGTEAGGWREAAAVTRECRQMSREGVR